MGSFTLDTSTLGGGIFTTQPVQMHGEFKDIQLHWTQAGLSQDLELHYIEFHFTVGDVIEHP